MLILTKKWSAINVKKKEMYNGQKETIGRRNEKTNIRCNLYVGVRTRIIWPGAISIG